jgi:4-aminobutyrate aminotransferase/(S)-3-amino-2-methylpropionate transaminase
MVTNADLHARRKAAVPRGWSSLVPAYIGRAENAELWDVEGNRFIDFASGIAVLNTGHLHPKVKAAVTRQLDCLSHTCFMVAPYEPAVVLAERLNALTPGKTPKKTLFVNSGAEAVENAVKIARSYTGRPGVIAFSGGFHGRTLLALALTGKVAPYKLGFGPFPGDIYHAPYPYAYRGVSVDDSLAAIERIFREDIEPQRVAAIIAEPVLGEGGFVPAPPEWLRELRLLCDQSGILFIADEIQTGFARTGAMFALEHAGIEADLMTFAKGLAGGFPLAAVTGKASIMDTPHPGALGGTYGGSPLGCAAGIAVLDVIDEEGLIVSARRLGALITEQLQRLAEDFPVIGDVRGLGAMVAMELVEDRASRTPAPALARALVQYSARHGLLVLSCGVNGNVIRILPPLTADGALVREGLQILERGLAELAEPRCPDAPAQEPSAST